MAKFEECLQRLEKIVQELEKGEVPLEKSLTLFEEGMQLSSACRKELEEAEGKVEIEVSPLAVGAVCSGEIFACPSPFFFGRLKCMVPAYCKPLSRMLRHSTAANAITTASANSSQLRRA